MWLVDELVLTFAAPIRYDKAQFNPIILTRVIVPSDAGYTTDRRQSTDTFVKNVFLTQGVSKHKDLMRIS